MFRHLNFQHVEHMRRKCPAHCQGMRAFLAVRSDHEQLRVILVCQELQCRRVSESINVVLFRQDNSIRFLESSLNWVKTPSGSYEVFHYISDNLAALFGFEKQCRFHIFNYFRLAILECALATG